MKKRIIATVCACVLAFGAAACGTKDDNRKGGDAEVKYEDIQLDTIHGGKAEITGFKVVDGGRSDYVIVQPANATRNEVTAVSIFQNYFEKATGIALTAVSDAAVTFSEQSKIISIGDTTASDAAGVSFKHKDKTKKGFTIKTAGKSIFIKGGESGAIYGVYELLNRWFDYECFGEFAYYVKTGISELYLFDFDINEVPDIEYKNTQMAGFLKNANDPDVTLAMGYDKNDIITGPKSNMHNSFTYLPYEEYGEAHRDWYSENVGSKGDPLQLCFSAVCESEEAFNITLERMKSIVRSSGKQSPIISFIHQDNTYWCTCARCKAYNERYNSQNVPYIYFLNKLARALHEWAEEELGLDDIMVTGLAYHANEAAPTYYDEKTKSYVPVDDTVKFDENLCMWFAPHSSDYQLPFDDPKNKIDNEALQSWAAIASRLIMYTYPIAVYDQMIMFYDTFNSIQRNYQLMTKYKVIYLLEDGGGSAHLTGFHDFKTYLASKLTWNSKLDMRVLTERFFAHYYGAASEPMKNMFDALRNRYTLLHRQGILNQKYLKYYSSELYPAGFVKTLKGFIAQAYAAIEPLKTENIEEYTAIERRICLESLSSRYIDIYTYGSQFSEQALLAERKAFKTDCVRLRMTSYRNNSTIEALWALWGI